MSKSLQVLAIFFLFSFIASSFSCLRPKRKGVVHFHDQVPPFCNKGRGLKQKKIIPVHSEKELRQHYGLTFQIRFNDGISPRLYGALYYQNVKKNLYCLALPNGRFASFSDSKVGRRRNVIQELCHPLQECERGWFF